MLQRRGPRKSKTEISSGAFAGLQKCGQPLTEAAKPAPEEDAKAVGRAALNLFCKMATILFGNAVGFSMVSTSQDEEPQGGDGKGGC